MIPSSRSSEVLLKTCNPESNADSGMEVAVRTPDHFWQSKAPSAKLLFFLKHCCDLVIRAANLGGHPEA